MFMCVTVGWLLSLLARWSRWCHPQRSNRGLFRGRDAFVSGRGHAQWRERSISERGRWEGHFQVHAGPEV